MPVQSDFILQDDGPLPGLADFIPEGRELSDSELDDIARSIDSAALPIQITLGPREVWASFLRSFARRKLLREHPPVEADLTWLEAHAPPNGTTMVRIGSSVSDERGLSASIFGSGGGTMRRVTITSSSESGPRPGCVSYTARFSVLPRIYSRGGVESVEVSVLGAPTLVTETRSRSKCQWCSALAEPFDTTRYLTESGIDLRGDNVPVTIARRTEVHEETAIEAGFTVPMIPASLKLTAIVMRSVSIEFQMQLAAGRRYSSLSLLEDSGAVHGPLWTTDSAEDN